MDRLTDREVYAWHFRKYDREADAAELAERMELTEGEKTREQKRDEFLALCASFGVAAEAAEAEWQKWLADQGA